MTRALRLAVTAAGLMLLGGVPAAQADLRVSQNYRISSDANPFRGSDQVNLAVNPNNPKHVVAAHVNFLSERCEATASFDGGVTWSPAFNLQVPEPGLGAPFLPSCRVSNHAGESMFDAVTFGSGNNVYATSITPRSTGGTEQGASTLVYKSTDGGVTWAAGTVAMPGGTGGSSTTGPYYELPSVLADPGAGTGGADIVYSIARDSSGSGNPGPCIGTLSSSCNQVRIARSLDGGQTWGAPVNVSPAAVPAIDAASPTIDADGNISVTYRTVGVPGANPNTDPTVGEIQFTRSTNQGQTWSAPVVITKVTNLARSGSSHVTPAPSNASSFPRMDVNKQNGNLYVVYNQQPPGPTAPAGGYTGADHFIPPDSQVWFQRSLDDGTTWSTPKRVNTDYTGKPGTWIHQTRHPDVNVAPNGRVDIVWEDRRHWYQGPGERTCVHTHIFCDDARLGDAYYAYSIDNGGSFTERRISDHSHSNDVGYDYRFATYWAFGPQAVALGSDDLLVAWMDSREGSFDTDIQDIYLAKVVRGASSTVPQERIDQPDAVNLSLALSKRTYRGGGEGLLQSTFATRNGTKVVIVNANDAAGALAGSVLARANLGPVLLGSTSGLSAAVKNEVARLNPAGAYVVGDTSQLSDQVVTDLVAAGVNNAQITRLQGDSAASTAAAVATAMDRRLQAEKDANAPAFDAVVLANPASPDAYAAAGLAAARRLPILYANAGSVPVATTAALAALDIDDVLVVGGTDDISSATAATLVPDTERLGGADQYATSRAVVQESLQRGLPSNIVYVANGGRPMDAALLGFAVGRSTGIMALSPASVSQTAPATASAADLTGIDRFVVVEASAPSAPPPPPPPPIGNVPTTPPPPPATVGAIKRLTGKISATVTPNRDLRAPYRFRTSGKLTLPKGITRAVGCTGRVSVQVKRGGTTISTRRVSLRKDCTYRSTVTFRNSKRFGRTIKSLRFTVRFLGNTRVAPARAASRFARVRR